MKLVRPMSAIPLLFLLGLGLFALQKGRAQGRRQQYSDSSGANVPSEFYWSRLQYNPSPAAVAVSRLRRRRWLDARLSPRPITIA